MMPRPAMPHMVEVQHGDAEVGVVGGAAAVGADRDHVVAGDRLVGRRHADTRPASSSARGDAGRSCRDRRSTFQPCGGLAEKLTFLAGAVPLFCTREVEGALLAGGGIARQAALGAGERQRRLAGDVEQQLLLGRDVVGLAAAIITLYWPACDVLRRLDADLEVLRLARLERQARSAPASRIAP